jgi:hypothetical protein
MTLLNTFLNKTESLSNSQTQLLQAYCQQASNQQFIYPLFLWLPIAYSSTASNIGFSWEALGSYVFLNLLYFMARLIEKTLRLDMTFDAQSGSHIEHSRYYHFFMISHLLLAITISALVSLGLIFFAVVYLGNYIFYAQVSTVYLRRLLVLCIDIGIPIMVGSSLLA